MRPAARTVSASRYDWGAVEVIAEMAKAVRQIPLTEDMVNRFIDSYAQMADAGKKFPETHADSKNAPSKEGEPPAAVDLSAISGEKRDAMNEVATEYGFKDLDEWATVGASNRLVLYSQTPFQPFPVSLIEKVRSNFAE